MQMAAVVDNPEFVSDLILTIFLFLKPVSDVFLAVVVLKQRITKKRCKASMIRLFLLENARICRGVLSSSDYYR